MADRIAECVNGFMAELNTLQNSIRAAADFHHAAWTAFYAQQVEITSPETFTTHDVPLGSALEYIAAQLIHFEPAISRARQPYCNVTWLAGFKRKCWSLILVVLDFLMAMDSEESVKTESVREQLSLVINIVRPV
jgi:hypothetical protein